MNAKNNWKRSISLVLVLFTLYSGCANGGGTKNDRLISPQPVVSESKIKAKKPMTGNKQSAPKGLVRSTTLKDNKIADKFYYVDAEKSELEEVEQDVDDGTAIVHNTEEYQRIYENNFKDVVKNPLSTFSIDVDTAAYANVRRMLNYGQTPYPDAVRIEEMINYFTYDYPEPTDKTPFSFNSELSTCPWNKNNKLLHLGLQAEKVDLENMPPNNLVFLLDVSGSMSDANKLPLLKGALKLLASQMRPQDTISIVVYAGAAGLVLKPTPGNDTRTIFKALNRLEAGGSTAGGAGIELAYKTALKNFDKEANNRVILCTDGDFNVGTSSSGELTRMIEKKRELGIFLTVLGFGMGNYKDSRMEQLANKGNGNYAYIDSILEAKKVLVTEMGGTLITIAKDVKIQIEFNPALVKEYRLIGYENRVMANEDFADDKKDAGELGLGHSVTALYELTMADSAPAQSDLKYQQVTVTDKAGIKDELLTIKFRYKKPQGKKSTLVVHPVPYKTVDLKAASDNFRWSAAVAQWGLILRGSEYKGTASYENIISLAKGSKGKDSEGYRSEFIQLVQISRSLSK